MEKIASFQIDHLRLKRGVFVSRIDRFQNTTITTFDLRLKVPNQEPVMDIAALHTLEHLGATFFRSHAQWQSRVIYFGPMGCRTGLYLLLEGPLSSPDIVELLKEWLEWTINFNQAVPGATAIECGNWSDHDLQAAQTEAQIYLAQVLKNPKAENLFYPGTAENP